MWTKWGRTKTDHGQQREEECKNGHMDVHGIENIRHIGDERIKDKDDRS
jgi:hypothetical protein